MSNFGEDISGADKLIRIFGQWPSFHDHEIVWLTLDRRGAGAPKIVLAIHAWRVPGVRESGLYELTDHIIVELQFSVVLLAGMAGLNERNILFSLDIEPIDPPSNDNYRYAVRMASSYGLSGEFLCENIEVLRVTSATEHGEPIC